ncbi:N-acetylmuramoyl-L-alanine amidase [Siminovitchia terrae]|uniref:N-acetylmuramoyl-L-alanine amidase n=1 Tax=Siminovitchia terrae TaxID=1914933 RepID=UPI0028AA48D1|nr:N-acetylmuramoyl-L-alanine amidase [Siminovitchia terrae]
MTNSKDILIYLDPGHAEYTPGKRAANPVFYEYAGNRRVARKLMSLLEAQGFIVRYSCNIDDPNDLSLASRSANTCNSGADVFLSIHPNALNDLNVRGTETFVHTNSKASLDIAPLYKIA